MNLLQEFVDFINKENLFAKKDHLLIGVSGGLDSVVLCELCHLAGFSFSIAHAHFGLRGEDSDKDAEFVRDLADRYQVRFYLNRFNTLELQQETGKGIQELARDLRYQWFNQLILEEKSNNYQHILTAHHANDQVETVLMNFCRGTGIRGLRGMLTKDGGIGANVVRPLLFASKQQLQDFAKLNNLSWREDVSNSKTDYTRNALRLEGIPALNDIFPSFADNVLSNSARFKSIDMLMGDWVKKWRDKYEIRVGNEIHWPVLPLQKQIGVEALLFELLHDYGFSVGQVGEAVKLLKAETGKYLSTSAFRLIRNRKGLILSPIATEISGFIPVELGVEEVVLPMGKLKIEHLPLGEIEKDAWIAQLDECDIEFPLWCRPWKTGDYFYPLGLNKKKKINRFLIDLKLSAPEKEKVWVIESKKRIIWVIGLRIDHRFSISPTTKSVLKMSLIPAK